MQAYLRVSAPAQWAPPRTAARSAAGARGARALGGSPRAYGPPCLGKGSAPRAARLRGVLVHTSQQACDMGPGINIAAEDG